ncbi:zinc-dependent alcohol dehydrogenase family protein [Paenibacillus sp. KN14-4R]|uniref:zinc-dependent alcohol dehydrogenase family protein n=1 Tax=Paenibacillus sp. KN14-4R TaxID=3445773 RepID=UPI003FA16F3C
MKAMMLTEYGGPSGFTLQEIARPNVPIGHVLIQVAATSVNPIDARIRCGLMPQLAPELPALLHGDVAGVIVEVGEGVTSFTSGDEVYGFAGGVRGFGGALGEYMIADARCIARKPRALTMAESAALPCVAVTAWNGLIERAALQPGQRVLVHGAAGGVGHVAIQLAAWAGADVYATASTAAKQDLARQLGARAAISYREYAVRDYVRDYTDGKGFDVVFDTVGKSCLDASFEAAAPGGSVIAIAARSTHDLSPLHAKGLTLHVVFTILPLLTGERIETIGQALTQLANIADSGHLRPLLDSRQFGFSQVAEAHTLLESGEAIGKVVLVNDL